MSATGVHPAAFVDERAQLGVGVEIGPGAVIGPHVKIGDGTTRRQPCARHRLDDGGPAVPRCTTAP